MLAGYSRLVIDLNRQPGDPQSILEVSDGVVIPGNAGLAPAAQEARAEVFHWPYHHAVDQAFARLRRGGPEPLFFSVHTFTPSLGGEDRFWDLGVLWNRDPRIAVPLIEILREQRGAACRRQPALLRQRHRLYSQPARRQRPASPTAPSRCARIIARARRDWTHFADLLADALERILAMPNVHRIEQF